MSTVIPPSAAVETRIIAPGEIKDFVYRGDMIPNQVSVENLDQAHQANFVVQAVNHGVAGWKLFGIIEPGQTVQLLVEWPTEARFTNRSELQSNIRVYGDGIFPKQDG
ncbi:MAG TPA: hypothetical protein VFS20_25085 [Longimicrobium sp.]|nr:hypothetical protein [Longimicrobium sp.]